MSRNQIQLTVALGLLIVTAVVVSLAEGAPQRLPGVALGSSVLFHAERTTALFGFILAVVTVLAQAARGRLPTQLSTSGVGYADDAAAADEAKAAIEAVQAQVDELREQLAELVGVFALDPGRDG